MIVTTRRLVLRPVRREDGPALLPLLADWNVVRWLARVPWPYTAADMDAWLATAVLAPHPTLTIVLGEQPIGQLHVRAVTEDVPDPTRSDVGFWLGAPFWGKGYMREALTGAVAAAFSAEPAAGPVRSSWFEGNTSSERTHLAVGFEATGRSTQHCLARKADLPLVTARLARDRFQALNP